MTDPVVRTKAALSGAAFLFVLFAAGCAGPGAFGGSRAAVVDWSARRGFQAETFRVGAFDLLALRRGGPGELLTIYIEGDGAPWHSPWSPPADPTPQRPVALAMAAADTTSNVAYLGRPCQYLDGGALQGCSVEYWTKRRFAPEVLAAYMVALDSLKVRHGVARLNLVGHSGGGVIATLLAQRRNDIDTLATVASPLALEAWVQHHRVSPLNGSLDPVTSVTPVLAGKAVHFAGEKDTVVPPAVIAAFVHAQGGRVVRLADQDHECCWVSAWPRLLEQLQ